MRKAVRTLALAGLVALGVSACTNNTGIRGYLFDPQLANDMYPGVDNRQSIQDTLGSPTLPATFDDDVWYYISTEVRTRPVFWPAPRTHRVMAVKFADNGMVESIINYDIDDTRRIFPNQDQTKTRGRELSFFQQLFSNIGQVGSGPAAQNQNRGPGPNG